MKYGDARDNEDFKGPRSTMPPRQRDGKEFPGGRHLCRAKRKLAVRQKNHKSKMPNQRGTACTYPGSMKL